MTDGPARPDDRPDQTDIWLRDNDAWLGAAIAHLRLTLAARAAARNAPPPGPPVAFAPPGASDRTGPPTQDQIAAAQRMRDARMADMQPAPALHLLAQRLGLSDFERDLLLLCAAMEIDTGMAALCAAAGGDAGAAYPTFALALAMLDGARWDVLSPQRPLRYWRLIEITQPAHTPLTQSALRADERIVNFIKGLSYLDDRITPYLLPFDAALESALPPSQGRAVDLAVSRLNGASGAAAPLLQLIGDDPASQQIVAQRAAESLGLAPFRLSANMLPTSPGDLERLARLWHRESILMPIALYIDANEAEEAPVARFVALSGGVFMLGARAARGDPGTMVQAVQVDRPTPSEQAQLWRSLLDAPPEATIARLSSQFDLDAPTIARIAAVSGRDADDGALWQACLDNSALRLDRLAERLRPVATWDDIVLPDPEMRLLRQLVAQVACRAQVYDDWEFRARLGRGLGISALFAGPSGTGKTMAAEVIAKALDLRLYRIDLSAVVSKYIGETEKNLRALFDAAEGGGAILFFDEADALFGKRSEVRDSHDRYANIETSYLLQRIESFRGLVIMSTNMRNALDQAFLRRLRFIVSFPYPGPAQRSAIWRRAWPDSVPRDALDYDKLGRLNLSGGNIATVALNAAFLAADAGESVTMAHVLAAARAEYVKLERPVNEADFRGLTGPLLREART